MKRVVTGNNQDGKSVFVSVGEPPRIITSEHGNRITYCWTTQETPVVPDSGDDPTLAMSSHFSAPGGTSFIIVEFPGHSETQLHTTDTVDDATILSGEIWLILDDGAEVPLTPGDCVVRTRSQGCREGVRYFSVDPGEIGLMGSPGSTESLPTLLSSPCSRVRQHYHG